MARAKRTDRAEARRRYRGTVAEMPASAGPDDGSPATTHGSATTRGSGASTPTRPVRPSIVGAFRNAIRPVNVRADIAALPTIARGSKAIWLPSLLILVAGLGALVVGLKKNIVVDLLFQVVLFPPAMVPAFLAGMLAPRASYLTGGVAGILSAIVFAVVISGVNLTIQQTPGGPEVAITSETRLALIENAIGLGIPFSIFVGAFSGFYRRFLALSNPNYGRPRPRPNKPVKPTGRRR